YALAAERFAKTERGPQAALARARLLAKVGRHGDAARAFERLIADSTARGSLARAGTPVDVLLAEWGWALVDAAKPAEADAVFSRLLKEYPESPSAADARFNLAESANLARNHVEVIRLLTPLATQKPSGDSLRRLLPAVLYRLGRTQVEVQIGRASCREGGWMA